MNVRWYLPMLHQPRALNDRLRNQCGREDKDGLLGAKDLRGQQRHQGVIAGFKASNLATEGSLAAILDGVEGTPLVLVLDSIQDPHNLGAILRTADAAGVHAVVAPKDKAVGITETVPRISVGAADQVPFAQVTNLARTMEKLKAAGIWLVGTSDHATSKSIYELDLKGPLAIIMGAEEKGMRRLTEDNCDFLASIPMSGKVECLNVSVATGVCLFEAVRQRRPAP